MAELVHITSFVIDLNKRNVNCTCCVTIVISMVAGVSLRGSNNIVYYNRMMDGEGACVRIGGNEWDDVDYGFDNEVRTICSALWHAVLCVCSALLYGMLCSA